MRASYFKGLAAGGLAAVACALAAGSVSASGDYFPPKFYSLSEGNAYSLFQPYADMAVPFLAPDNDGRVNLLLLLADARKAHPHFLSSPTSFGRHGRYIAETPVDFATFTAVFDDARLKPAAAVGNTPGVIDGQGDRCRSNTASAAAYVAALKSSAAPASAAPGRRHSPRRTAPSPPRPGGTSPATWPRPPPSMAATSPRRG